jgi:integrase
LLNSVIAPHAKAFAAHLERGRYAANTTGNYLGSIAHLARWMTYSGLPVQRLDESAVEQFLGKHLPRCDCPKPVMRVHDDLRAACNHLLNILREQGVIAEREAPTDPVAAELRCYDGHMRDVRGLIASTGVRISEALDLLDTDVDLKFAMLTIRQTKFAKSRQLPLHPSTVDALERYRWLRTMQVRTTPETPFFVGTRGRLLGQPLGDRQVHRVFNELRDRLCWVNRGAHDGPRIHDLRHSFAVRRVMLWHVQGIDVDQAMLSLSTYLGHAKISNTYWYLTGVPELMAVAGGKFERFAEVPGAGHE